MEKAAANLILGRKGTGDKFIIKYGWISLHLHIRPITTEQIVKISRELAQVNDVDAEGNMFLKQMEEAGKMPFICRAIAIATGTRYVGIVTRAIMKLPFSEVAVLWAIVEKWSDPSSFFFIFLRSAKLKKLKTTKEES